MKKYSLFLFIFSIFMFFQLCRFFCRNKYYPIIIFGRKQRGPAAQAHSNKSLFWLNLNTLFKLLGIILIYFDIFITSFITTLRHFLLYDILCVFQHFFAAATLQTTWVLPEVIIVVRNVESFMPGGKAQALLWFSFQSAANVWKLFLCAVMGCSMFLNLLFEIRFDFLRF